MLAQTIALLLLARAAAAGADPPAGEGSPLPQGAPAAEEPARGQPPWKGGVIGSADAWELPAATYGISGEELRRSGHSSLAEALRMAPGFHVVRRRTNAWDVTARGYTAGVSPTSEALLTQVLVMVDGVVVSTPLFSGTWWPLLDIDLDDVERVEIVRGPAGVLTGTSAVNGIVHVITKDSARTQGLRASARQGTDDRHVAARAGGALGERGAFRVWGTFSEYDPLARPFLGVEAERDIGGGGFRADWSTESGKRLTLWGRGYDGAFTDPSRDPSALQPAPVRSDRDGHMLLAALEDPASGTTLRTWYALDRQDDASLAEVRIETLDVELSRVLPLSATSTLTLGVGYRVIHSRLRGDDPAQLSYEPADVVQRNLRVFLAERVLLPALRLTIEPGLQVEHNEFTRMETQPTLRATWTPQDDLLLWTGFTHTVRTPSIEERTLTAKSAVSGNPGFGSEKGNVAELGARRRLSERASLDLALFWSSTYDLGSRSVRPSGKVLLDNDVKGESWGGELALDLRPVDRWRLRAAYALLQDGFERAHDGIELVTADASPRHLANLRSYLDLGADWELDLGVYAVEGLGGEFEDAEHVRVDARLGWRASDELWLAIGAQDLGHETRSEFDGSDALRRSLTLSLTYEPRPRAARERAAGPSAR